MLRDTSVREVAMKVRFEKQGLLGLGLKQVMGRNCRPWACFGMDY